MKSKITKTHHRVLLLIILVGLVVLSFSGYSILQINDTAIELDFGIADLSNFAIYAIALSLLGEMIPSVAKQFVSFGAVGIKLLIQGFSPILFGLILAVGQTIGQMLLYVVGMFVKKVHKGSIGDLASKNHYLHQHHFLVYLAVPFSSVLGDFVMLYSGHQRINPIKIIPFLFIANLTDNFKWIFTSMAQLEIGDTL